MIPMLPQAQSLSPGYSPSMILPATTSHFSTTKLISFSTTSSSIKPFTKNTTKLSLSKNNSCLNSSIKPLRCSVFSVISEPTQIDFLQEKPSPAEVARTIMELSCVGTLSTLTSEGSPLGIGVRFAVDSNGTPIFCLNSSDRLDRKSSLHVQFEQSGTRTTQCTLQGSLDKPEDRAALQNFHSIWEKRFDEEVDPDLIYVVSVEKILQKEDFKEDGIWVDSSEYDIANPDPLRDSAKNIVSEINTNHKEDFERICSVYVDLEVTHAKAIWVDRLGFDVHIHSERAMFQVRIPFPREMTDEKGAKSSFNCMSQLAWEVEKRYTIPDFEKGKLLKQIR